MCYKQTQAGACALLAAPLLIRRQAQAVKPEVVPAAGGTALKKNLFGLSIAQQQLKSSDLGVILNSIYQAVPTLQKQHVIISESS